MDTDTKQLIRETPRMLAAKAKTPIFSGFLILPLETCVWSQKVKL